LQSTLSNSPCKVATDKDLRNEAREAEHRGYGWEEFSSGGHLGGMRKHYAYCTSQLDLGQARVYLLIS
jgi:hypothetical protein